MTSHFLAVRLIQSFEGCRLAAYWDRTGKKWTIGFGHTRTAIKGMTISQAQADTLFIEDVAPLFALVADKPILEAAALISFGYNCGAGALRRVLKGEVKLIDWGRVSGGVALAGLGARRDLEAALIELSGAGKNNGF